MPKLNKDILFDLEELKEVSKSLFSFLISPKCDEGLYNSTQGDMNV